MKKFAIFLMLICLESNLQAEEIIKLGDTIKLKIVGVLENEYQVTVNGNIDFGLWGKIHVAGMNEKQAKNIIKKKLSKVIRFQNKPVFLSIKKPPQGTSWLRNRPDQVVHVFGQISKPGRYEIKEGFSLMDVLSHGGGTTNKADNAKITITSQGKTTYFNLQNYLESGGVLPNIKPGDIIFIPESSEVPAADWIKIPSKYSIYLIGQVAKPGRYDFTPMLNFMDFLAQAGGPTEKADTKRISVIRKNRPSQTFNFYLYQQGKKQQLPALLAEDVIYIPSINPDEWIKKDPKTLINVIGAVNKPGRYEVEPNNLNLIDIISAAGGLKTSADINNIKVLHRNPLGNEKKALAYIFDFEEFQESGSFDTLPKVKLGDTIIVPEQEPSFWTEFSTIGGTLGIIGNTFVTVAAGMALGQSN